MARRSGTDGLSRSDPTAGRSESTHRQGVGGTSAYPPPQGISCERSPRPARICSLTAVHVSRRDLGSDSVHGGRHDAADRYRIRGCPRTNSRHGLSRHADRASRPACALQATRGSAIWLGLGADVRWFTADAGWSSSVARWAHNPEVTGSNPVPATTKHLVRARLL